jgi:hypothetical protein
MLVFYSITKLLPQQGRKYSLKLCYHTSFQDVKGDGASVAPASQFPACDILSLLITENYSYIVGALSNGVLFVQITGISIN